MAFRQPSPYSFPLATWNSKASVFTPAKFLQSDSYVHACCRNTRITCIPPLRPRPIGLLPEVLIPHTTMSYLFQEEIGGPTATERHGEAWNIQVVSPARTCLLLFLHQWSNLPAGRRHTAYHKISRKRIFPSRPFPQSHPSWWMTGLLHCTLHHCTAFPSFAFPDLELVCFLIFQASSPYSKWRLGAASLTSAFSREPGMVSHVRWPVFHVLRSLAPESPCQQFSQPPSMHFVLADPWSWASAACILLFPHPSGGE